MILYHGTSLSNAKKILKEGLKPRGKKKSNWETGIGKSRKDLVYLTNCYACYYASSSVKKESDKSVVLKLDIDPKELELYPDEEFLFRSSGIDKMLDDKEEAIKVYEHIDPKDVKLFKNVETGEPVSWKDSLEYMGTVAVKKVPKEMIVGYYIEKKEENFIMYCDPCISPLNYKFCGQMYKDVLKKFKYKPLEKISYE